ncbi:MAG: YaaA family protein, partial [Fulvivirga sp.]|nr:YaaA family protein [Fulvivirga sp.]
MIALLSPAKSLDFEKQNDFKHTLPYFQDKALNLIEVLKEKSEEEVQELMSISEKLATLNVERYHNFTKTKDPKHAKQAIFAFQGDVYQGLNAATMSADELDYTQQHVRILS